jgi:hypothetical protein
MPAASEPARDAAPAESEQGTDMAYSSWVDTVHYNWRYVAPYKQDVRTTLQHLREHVVASGEYDKGHGYRVDEEPASLDELMRRAGARTPSILDIGWIAAPAPPPVPKGQLARFDLAAIPDPAGEPAQGIPVAASGIAEDAHTIRPLSVQQLVRLFGTEKPTRRLVEAEEDGLIANLARPIYIVIYEDRRGWHEDDAQPEEIWFASSSGGGP